MHTDKHTHTYTCTCCNHRNTPQLYIIHVHSHTHMYNNMYAYSIFVHVKGSRVYINSCKHACVVLNIFRSPDVITILRQSWSVRGQTEALQHGRPSLRLYPGSDYGISYLMGAKTVSHILHAYEHRYSTCTCIHNSTVTCSGTSLLQIICIPLG